MMAALLDHGTLSFGLGLLAALLLLAAVFLEYEGIRRYRVERGWALAIEQYDALHDFAGSSPDAL